MDIYKHWNSDKEINKYKQLRKYSDRFRSEVYFLDKIFETAYSLIVNLQTKGEDFGDLEQRLTDLMEKTRLVEKP